MFTNSVLGIVQQQAVEYHARKAASGNTASSHVASKTKGGKS